MPKRKLKLRPWLKSDLKTLKTMSRKSPAGTIAHVLKRTEGATRQKAFSIGLSLSTRG